MADDNNIESDIKAMAFGMNANTFIFIPLPGKQEKICKRTLKL